jgi:pseudaminic acid cytidylyltransferase
MKNLAIIPARGGSKRIPRKNIKPFMGKPIIAYSIEAALQSGIFDEVMVSTDDEEIAEVAKQYGANVPFMRSKRAADDYATTSDVIKEVLYNYEKLGKMYDSVCCIYATAPFISSVKLIEAMELINSKKFDSAFTLVQYSYPIQRSLSIKSERVMMLWPEYLNTRSQDLEVVYHDAGQFYIATVDALEVNQDFL